MKKLKKISCYFISHRYNKSWHTQRYIVELNLIDNLMI